MKTSEMSKTMSEAEICRQMGWQEGTRLVGDEGFGPTVIEITSLRPNGKILAKGVSRYGKKIVENESFWTLSCRDWEEVK